MFKLLVVTLAAFFAVLQIFGDPARRPEVSRTEPEGLTLASFATVAEKVDEISLAPQPRFSEAEAIAMALDAGKEARESRDTNPTLRRGSVELAAATEAVNEVAPVEAAQPDFWYVSGSRVNLRQGPGTGNAVVAQVTFGTEALVLDSRDGWMQIETTDGATTGWIYGDFLNDKKPG